MSTQLCLGKCFCFDTSALSNMWHRHYPPAVFPAVWRVLADAIDAYAAIAPLEVYYELERKCEPKLTEWFKAHRRMFVPDSLELVSAVLRVEREYPNLVEYNKERYDADPWVVALAELHAASVVTGEHGCGSLVGGMLKPRMKIPDVCKAKGIPLATVPDFIEARGAAL